MQQARSNRGLFLDVPRTVRENDGTFSEIYRGTVYNKSAKKRGVNVIGQGSFPGAGLETKPNGELFVDIR